jgi:hypothetical protein
MERKNVTATTDLSSSGACEGHAGRSTARARAPHEARENPDGARLRDSLRNGSGGAAASGAGAAPPLNFEQVYEANFDFVWRSLRLLGVQDAAEAPSLEGPVGAAASAAPRLDAPGSVSPSGASSTASSDAASSITASSHAAANPTASSAAPASALRAASAPPPARRRPRSRSVSTLGAEVALLERGERAIRAGEGELALALLDELDEKFPVSPLREERAAARVLATCVNTRSGTREASDSAQANARRFVAKGSSLYADRVRQLCALGDENSRASGEEPADPGH